MRFPRPSRAATGGRRRTLGQAMVEMALVAPLVIMLFVFAVDFGRAFFGWVGLQNAARIGANYAGSHADAWSAPDTPIKTGQRQELIDEITRDARSINCALQAIPTPVFTAVGTAAAGDMGSHASITLQCNFELITRAFVGAIVGNPLHLGATATFPVRNGAVAGLPTPVPTPTPAPMCTVPDFKNSSTSAAQTTWSGAGFTTTVTFNPALPPDYTIKNQSIPKNASRACASTTITVAP